MHFLNSSSSLSSILDCSDFTASADSSFKYDRTWAVFTVPRSMGFSVVLLA